MTEISQRTLVRKTLPRNGRERPAVQQFNADVRLVVVSPSGAPDHYSAHDYRGRLLVASSRQPLPDSCRVLLSEGADPNAWVHMRHAGSNTDALRTKVGIGAKLTVEDGPDGRPRFRPYRPYPLALSPHKRKTDLPLQGSQRRVGAMSALIPVDRLFFNFNSCPRAPGQAWACDMGKVVRIAGPYRDHPAATRAHRAAGSKNSTEPDAAWEGWREAAREYHARRRR